MDGTENPVQTRCERWKVNFAETFNIDLVTRGGENRRFHAQNRVETTREHTKATRSPLKNSFESFYPL